MDKLLDIISRWDHFGQGLFLFLVLCAALASFNFAVKMLVVLFRGWPPSEVEKAQTPEEE